MIEGISKVEGQGSKSDRADLVSKMRIMVHRSNSSKYDSKKKQLQES